MQTPANEIALCLRRFSEWMQVRGYSEDSIYFRQKYLKFFIVWCEERGIAEINEITKSILERYQRHIYYRRTKDDKPLSVKTQEGYLSSIRVFFKWLTRENYIYYNPASEIDSPKMGKRLPRSVLTQAEVERVINLPDINRVLGLRDRAIMETLYSTGIRRMELIGLDMRDLDVKEESLMVREGKGKKDRIIPIGRRAIKWIVKYLEESRPKLLSGKEDVALFVTSHGERMKRDNLTDRMHQYVDKAAIGKKGSCHVFRHTMATLMLENGADIRYIQAMLGHAGLAATQIYTHVSIKKLKEIHTATHPAKLKSKFPPSK